MIRRTLPAWLFVAVAGLALGACTVPLGRTAADRTPEQRQNDAQLAACRQEADRVMQFRDRGQTMRLDEADARVGVATNVPTLRAETDRLGARVERDRLIGECLRGGSGDAVGTNPPQGLPGGS